MKLEFDSTEKPETLRAVAAFALMLAGDIDIPSVRDELPDGVRTSAHGIGTQVQNLPRAIVSARDPGPHPLDAPANVLPFPSAPPAPSILGFVPAGATPAAAAVVMADAVAPLLNAPHAFNPPMPGAVPNRAPPIVTPLSFPAPTAAPPNMAPPASVAAAVQAAASVEYDSAGLPWDARIHNKGRTKKKDGTWKLQKGLDPIIAQAIVAELAAKRVSIPSAGTSSQTNGMPAQSAPVSQNQPTAMYPMQSQISGPAQGGAMGDSQPLGQGPLTPEQEARAAYGNRAVGMMPELAASYIPSQVPLPPTMPHQYPMAGQIGSLPLPPFPREPAPAMVPPPSIAAPVPVTPQSGAVGGVSPPVSGYKQLIDKLTAATQNKSLNPALVAPTVQRFGVPNMGMLGDPTYAGLLPAISQEFDRLIAGGAPSGP